MSFEADLVYFYAHTYTHTFTYSTQPHCTHGMMLCSLYIPLISTGVLSTPSSTTTFTRVLIHANGTCTLGHTSSFISPPFDEIQKYIYAWLCPENLPDAPVACAPLTPGWGWPKGDCIADHCAEVLVWGIFLLRHCPPPCILNLNALASLLCYGELLS